MYKIFTVLFSLITMVAGAQSFQATIKPGTTAGSVVCVIKPSTNFSDAPSNIQFTIAIPQSVGTRPVMSMKTNNYSSFFATSALIQTATSGTDYIYLVNMMTPTLTTKNYTANLEDEVAELSFTGNIGNRADIKLVQLTEGKATAAAGSEDGNYNTYIEFATASDKTNAADVFYSTTGGTVSNNIAGYNGYSYVTVGSGTLPLTWINFAARKEGPNALLNWTVANQVNTSHFEIEAGGDVNKLATIGTLAATTATAYSFVHKNFIDVDGRSIYYRIKQVDKDGKFSYSQMAKLSVEKGFLFSVMGNPAMGKDVKFAIQAGTNNKGTISIMDANGKRLLKQNISWSAGYTEQVISLPTASKGVYIALLQVGDQQFREKFIR